MLDAIHERYKLTRVTLVLVASLILAIPSLALISFIAFIINNSLRVDMFNGGDFAVYAFSLYGFLIYCVAFMAFIQFIFFIVGNFDSHEIEGLDSGFFISFEFRIRYLWGKISTIILSRLFPAAAGSLVFLLTYGKLTIEHMPTFIFLIPFSAYLSYKTFFTNDPSQHKYSAGIAGLIFMLAIQSGEMRANRIQSKNDIIVNVELKTYCGKLIFLGFEKIIVLEDGINHILNKEKLTSISVGEPCRTIPPSQNPAVAAR